MSEKRAVYIVGGVSDFRPPALWRRLSAQGDAALEEAGAKGELEPLYGVSFLWRGFESLAAEAERIGFGLGRVGRIELGLSYPRKLSGLSEEEVEADFARRLKASAWASKFSDSVQVRLRPTTAASASGMVPVNDALGDVLDGGCDAVMVVAGGNVKGTRPGCARMSVEESTAVLGSLISPLDCRLTGANMLKLAAVTLARAYQHDSELTLALHKHLREQRASVHSRLRAGLIDEVHISDPPEKLKDRVVWEPMHLMGLAPQSMGYSGLLISSNPEGPSPVRVIGAGAGIEATSIREREDLLCSRAMVRAMDMAFEQARIREPGRLWLFEAHNPFPGVLIAETRRLLAWKGERDGLAAAFLEDRAGAMAQPFLINPNGGALAGHPITPTSIRLLRETARTLAAGHPAGLGPKEGVGYAAVSAVGGHHTFDGFFLLAAGRPEDLAALDSGLRPFAHDELDASIRQDEAEEEARDCVRDPGPLSLGFISRSEPDRKGGREYFGVAIDAVGRHIPFVAPAALCESLRSRAYVGLPARVNGRLELQPL